MLFDDDEEFDLNQEDPGSLVDFSGANTQYSAPFGNNDEDTLANTQRFSRPPLRSRPAMDFSGRQPSAFGSIPPTNVSGRQSTVGSNFDYSATLFSQPRSQASGSTLPSSLKPDHHFPRSSLKPEPFLPHSSFKPEPFFPHKAPYFEAPYFDASNIPPAVIAALTITQLYHNPHYRELRQRHDDVNATLAKYVERDLSQPQVQVSSINTAPPAIYQGALRFSTARATLLTQSP